MFSIRTQSFALCAQENRTRSEKLFQWYIDSYMPYKLFTIFYDGICMGFRNNIHHLFLFFFSFAWNFVHQRKTLWLYSIKCICVHMVYVYICTDYFRHSLFLAFVTDGTQIKFHVFKALLMMSRTLEFVHNADFLVCLCAGNNESFCISHMWWI